MSIGASRAPTATDDNVVAALEVDADGRWDALALFQLLVPFHAFLVQHTTDRWVVHASVPGRHGESLSEALRTIEEWRAGRSLEAPIRLNAQTRGG